MPGMFVGELAALIGALSMVGTTAAGDRWTAALCSLHVILSLVGVELAIYWALYPDTPPEMVVFGISNWFNLTLCGVMTVLVFPNREDSGSILPLLEVTFSPFVFAAIWSVSAPALSSQDLSFEATVQLGLLFLGLHYYIVSATMIVLLMVTPPPGAPAGQLELKERFMSGFGVFFIGLIGMWCWQGVHVFEHHGSVVYGDTIKTMIPCVFLSLIGAYRAARFGVLKLQ